MASSSSDSLSLSAANIALLPSIAVNLEPIVPGDSPASRSSSTVEIGKPSVKKAKNTKKDVDAKVNEILCVMKDIGTGSAEVIAVDKKSEEVSSDGAQSLVTGKLLARKEAAAKYPSNAAMQLEVDKNKGKHDKEATVERSSLRNGKKGSFSTVEVEKSSVKKPKKSEKERGTKVNDTVMKETGDNSAEEKENMAVDNNSGREKSPVPEKPVARKEAAKSAKTVSKADKASKQLSSKPLASRRVLQDQEQEQQQ